MPEPEFARMTLPYQAGVVALSLGGGAVLGLVGTFAHQSLPPFGVAIALATVGLYIVGLRAWGGVRTPAAAGSIGLALVVGPLATAGGGTVLVPANAAGYAWLGGVTAVMFFALAWPHIQRAPRRTADTMEEYPDVASTADPTSR
ncbi:MAG: hypothetical protein Q7J04_04170 [Microcella sp.]|nr:hypothetical protein [Microcella sp.]